MQQHKMYLNGKLRRMEQKKNNQLIMHQLPKKHKTLQTETWSSYSIGIIIFPTHNYGLLCVKHRVFVF